MQEIDEIQGLTPPKHGGTFFFTFLIILSFFALVGAGLTVKQDDRTAVAPAQKSDKPAAEAAH